MNFVVESTRIRKWRNAPDDCSLRRPKENHPVIPIKNIGMPPLLRKEGSFRDRVEAAYGLRTEASFRGGINGGDDRGDSVVRSWHRRR